MIGLIMLVVFVLYLLVAISVTRWLARIPKRSSYKWLMALLTLAVFALIPTWDEVLGRMYFKHLCETEGGVKVYKTVGLGPEYFTEDASPNYFSSQSPKYFFKSRSLDAFLLEDRYVGKSEWEEKYSQLLNIARDRDLIIDTSTNQVLSNHTFFVFFRGWVLNSTGLVVGGQRCPQYAPGTYTELFLRQVFRHSHTK